MINWMRNLLAVKSKPSRACRRRHARYRPLLELLENRLAPAHIYQVMGTTDSAGSSVSSGTGTAGDPFLIGSLRGAIIATNGDAGSTIIVPTGTYKLTLAPTNPTGPGSEEQGNTTFNSTAGDIDINGSGTIIRGASAATTIIQQTVAGEGVLDVNPALANSFHFTLQNVTITGGDDKSTLGGGGVRAGGVGSVVEFDNCVFSGNHANGIGESGGAIAFQGGTLTVQNNTFTSNSTTGSGGALSLAGASVTSVSITGSSFVGNTASDATNGFGGAIESAGTGTVAVQFNRFVGNTAGTASHGNVLSNNAADTGTLNANENWWGTNSGPAPNDFTLNNGGTSTPGTVASYLKLEIGAASTALAPGGGTTVTADFLKDSNGTAVAPTSLSALIGQPVTFTQTSGSITAIDTTIQATGQAKATYTAGATVGPASASAMVDNGTATVNINITAPAPIPILTSISPTSALAGSPDTTITLTGTNFLSNSTVDLGATPLATTFVNSTTLTTVIPAADLVMVGPASITVVTPGPGGGTSVGQIFSVNNAVPTLTSISPNSTPAGSPNTTITLTGTNFLSNSTADLGATPLATTFVNGTTLTAVIPAANLTTGGTPAITVVTPGPGGGTSAAQTFTISSPAPTLTSISPTSVLAGSPNTTITMTGTNFLNNSTVDLGATPLVTTFVNGTTLTAVIPAANLTTAGTASVTVITPGPGGGTSAAKTFTINNPAPTLTSISPISVLTGSPDTTITLNGSNFVTGSMAKVGGTPITTTFVSPTKLTAVIPAADLTAVGTPAVAVVNPTPGGGASAPQTLTINAPVSIGNLTQAQWTLGLTGFTGTLPISGGIGPFTITLASGLPPGLTTVLSGPRTIGFTGTPTVVGTFANGIVTVQDNGASTSVTKTFSIAINPAQSLTSGPLPDAIVGLPYNQTIAATGGTGNSTLVVSNIVGAIPGLSIPTGGTNSLVIAGTPTGAGTVSFTVTATDSVGAVTTTSYALAAGDTMLSYHQNTYTVDLPPGTTSTVNIAGGMAYFLDQSLGLHTASSFFFNYYGANEKWLKGNGNPFGNTWYSIEPNGRFSAWPGTPGIGTALLATLDPVYYTYPELLYQATPGTLDFVLQQRFGLQFTGNYYQNYGGRNEKWLGGPSNAAGVPTSWYFIDPMGQFYLWDGVPHRAAGTFLATLDPTYWSQPDRLYKAQNDKVTETVVNNVLQIKTIPNWVGRVVVDINTTAPASNHQTFTLNWVNHAPVLTVTPTGTTLPVPPSQPLIVANLTTPVGQPTSVTLAATDADAEALTFSAVGGHLGYALKQNLGLRFQGSLYFNYGGANEKWLQSTLNNWYFIKPDGTLTEWDGTANQATGTLVATLDPVYYYHPDLLYAPPVGDLAFALYQGLSLTAPSTAFAQNYGGQNEKWLTGSAGVYFIKPNGTFYLWDGTVHQATGTLLATLNTDFYTNVGRLYNNPAPSQVAVNRTGNTLTLTPTAGFIGQFWFTVKVTDGSNLVAAIVELNVT